MKIGFTGTRNGMTAPQLAAFSDLLDSLHPTAFHHGACVGADAQAAEIAMILLVPEIIAHPGVSAYGTHTGEHRSQRAIDMSTSVLPEKTHFARNRDIVAACAVLIVTPWQTPEELEAATSGGTVYTLGVARKAGKRIVIVYPDGSVKKEGNWA